MTFNDRLYQQIQDVDKRNPGKYGGPVPPWSEDEIFTFLLGLSDDDFMKVVAAFAYQRDALSAAMERLLDVDKG